MKLLGAVAVILLAASAAAESPVDPTSLTGAPAVEVEGTIARIQGVRGQGTPSLEVESGGKITTVRLGSMRYLLSNDFNPRAGEPIKVEGYQQSEHEVVARTVTLPAQNKKLELRDKDGRPLWQGGRRHRNRGGENGPQGTNK